MAEPNHKGAASPVLPTNPLSRPLWARTYTDPSQDAATTLAGLTIAISALTRILANSEAFRDLHANSQSDTTDLNCRPLDAPTTEGLFAALHFLSEQAEKLSQLPLPMLLHPGDAQY